jgi:hypothetical protein
MRSLVTRKLNVGVPRQPNLKLFWLSMLSESQLQSVTVSLGTTLWRTAMARLLYSPRICHSDNKKSINIIQRANVSYSHVD